MRKSFVLLVLCAACQARPQAEPAPPPLGAAKAASFVSYQEKLIPLLRAWVKASNENKASGKLGKYGGSFADKYEGLGVENGLSDQELHALGEVAAFVAVRDPEMKQRFGAQVSQMEKSVAALPEQQRAATQETLAGVRRVQGNLLELRDLRGKYGDEIVEAMLQREADLKRQRAELASIQ